MAPLLLPWSDQDQALMIHYKSGMERIHQRFVMHAVDTIVSNPAFHDALTTITADRLRKNLSAHITTLIGDPRTPEVRSESARIGWAHIQAGIPPSWYLVLYNAYFKSYHEEQDVDATRLPPLTLIRRRWLLDVADTLDAYDQNAQATLQAMTHRVLDLESFAYQDPLTGIANRLAVEEAIERYAGTSALLPRAFVLIDLDGFKTINDSEGHPRGDEMLRQVATHIASKLSPTDMLGRIGGDEFCLWLTARESFSQTTSDVQQILKNLGGDRRDIGCSAGVSWYPRDGQNFRSLYSLADAALYQAKRQGKNRIVVRGNDQAFPIA